jgi:GNAT superfamily N-acetyltransferase
MAFFVPRIETTLPDCIVATVDGEIVGFAGWEGGGIGQVFILPAWHGRGVAPLVLGAAEDKLRDGGHTLIWLQCQVGNDRARRFYEKHGWRIAQEVEVSIGTVEGRKPQLVWRMEKALV